MARASIQIRFGQRVRDLRVEAGLSQDDLAWRCKISRTYLSQLEVSSRNPTLVIIEKIAAGLKVPMRDLMNL